MTPVEEIKSKLSVEQLIAEYVTLKQSGTNFKGLCPFHQEKTPSFMVSPEKQIWHCFGCNEGGDAISFVEKYEGLDFKGALEMLAHKTGVELRGFSVSDQSKKKVLYDIHEEAAAFYASHLASSSADAVKTREYLKTRGLTDESIRQWGLGLSPDGWDVLAKHLQEKKFNLGDITSAGLVISREQKVYDRFRRRLMFPIRDSQGRTVAFTARTLQYIVHEDADQAGKYVNSPQTPVYNKSQILYGFDQAKHDVKRLNYAIIVEGNMDVIMSHQAGIENAVAVSGTALTMEQLKLLKRYTGNSILSFDADTAGSQAVFRGITLAWDYDMNVKVIVLTEGKDPAEIIQHDPERWREAIKKSIGVVDFYFDAVFARVDLTRADHKKLAAKKITGIISRLKTKVEQAHYATLLAERLQVREPIIWSMITAPEAVVQKNDESVIDKKAALSLVGRHFVAFIIQHPAHLVTAFNEIEPDMLEGDVQELYKKIIIQYTKEQSPNFRDLATTLAPDELSLWSELVFTGEQVYGQMNPIEQEQELALLLKRIKQRFFTAKLRELTEAIRRAEQTGDQQRIESLLREFHVVSAKRTT